MIVVLMGPSGCGKTTVGQALAAALGWEFLDADDLHPPANVDKMRRGIPLGDADRWAWLAAVSAAMNERLPAGRSCVVACSALREAYRALFRSDDIHVVLLDVPPAVLAERLQRRQGHFMPPSLLATQLATLERPRDGLIVDGNQPVPAVVAAIRHILAI